MGTQYKRIKSKTEKRKQLCIRVVYLIVKTLSETLVALELQVSKPNDQAD